MNIGEKVKANDWKTIDNLRKYWQKYGREVMGDDPIAWNAMKERRREEKQRRAIAEAKKLAEKVGTEILTKLPSQAEFPMQKREFERGYIGKMSHKLFLERVNFILRCDGSAT